jgi:hypothetical protein
MLEETNIISSVFSRESDVYLGMDYNSILLNRFAIKLKEYLKDLSTDRKPVYDFGWLADYTHISANFGLYRKGFQERTEWEVNAELINSGLNVSSSTTTDQNISRRLSVELHLPEDSFVADYLYGTSVPITYLDHLS